MLDGTDMDVTGSYLHWALNLVVVRNFPLAGRKGVAFCSVSSLSLLSAKSPETAEDLPCNKLSGHSWSLQPCKMQVVHLNF